MKLQNYSTALALDCYECKNDQDCATTGDEGVLITCNETISTAACYYANISKCIYIL